MIVTVVFRTGFKMKYFIAIALIATVASAAFIKPSPVTAEQAELQDIIAAIASPSTDPATAAALEQMLLDILGVQPEPIAVGPAIIEQSPISVGPAIVDFAPVAIGPAIIDFPLPTEDAVVASPAAVSPAPAASTPLVQIILNINQVESSPAAASPIAVGPAIVAEPVDASHPVNVVDVAFEDIAPVAPVEVVDVAPVSPVQVVDVAPVAPVQVVDVAPVSPVIIGTPVLPSPAVVLPEELN